MFIMNDFTKYLKMLFRLTENIFFCCITGNKNANPRVESKPDFPGNQPSRKSQNFSEISTIEAKLFLLVNIIRMYSWVIYF